MCKKPFTYQHIVFAGIVLEPHIASSDAVRSIISGTIGLEIHGSEFQVIKSPGAMTVGYGIIVHETNRRIPPGVRPKLERIRLERFESIRKQVEALFGIYGSLSRDMSVCVRDFHFQKS